MTLAELIEALERVNQDAILPLGFTRPHSYRGYYDQLAFEPAKDVPVRAMLADAKGALGTTFTGYKGGEYTMCAYTDVWLAEYGCCGETIGQTLLGFMLAAEKRAKPRKGKP